MNIIDSLKWRYATKKFDPNKKVSDTDIATLKEAVRLTPSSYGFQLYKVIIVTDQKMKDKLYKESYYQSQIRDCSHLFVFCSYKTVSSKHIDEFIDLMEQGRQQDDERAYVDKMKSKAKIMLYGTIAKADIGRRDKSEALHWMQKQCYLAVSQLMVTCADMRIDSCPFEGFSTEAYDKILDLDNSNLTSTVLLPVGYRTEDDRHQFRTKVRKPLDKLFEDR
ncbi:MAG: NAD(P)H-dependent oxidoreductase [Candidatus Marinimicrobia bacterium]|jgi:nitroreductase|nr:NAD(P)H-dependent oxidoreductase [Paracoccaceae bacterium]MBL6911850.1 NAD(P)H-dependent oxidoreductase [Candidatus Neomarinimicrobiota bacterium]MBT3728250.1 NAD(P)H-dependent oxidoreductase [Candidatus Neomarinimicrobiota bacterium]MBT3944363.1 NAD(P)H-dependent oxidoreductase [Candidatus Neomarinimicrobiota bacterium]MBT4112334.1 NAD(P)H-dependent oxidoreductase [Candidatus Neomarinimicrobiota bacterium]